MFLVATFPSTQTALSAERELAGKVPVELIPMPRQIHNDCGFCLLVGPMEPGEPASDAFIAALRDQGAAGLWRVVELVSPASRRKEKRYEPYP